MFAFVLFDERNNQFPPLAEIDNEKVVRISENKSLIRKKISGEFFGIMKLTSHGSYIFMKILEKSKSHPYPCLPPKSYNFFYY